MKYRLTIAALLGIVLPVLLSSAPSMAQDDLDKTVVPESNESYTVGSSCAGLFAGCHQVVLECVRHRRNGTCKKHKIVAVLNAPPALFTVGHFLLGVGSVGGLFKGGGDVTAFGGNASASASARAHAYARSGGHHHGW